MDRLAEFLDFTERKTKEVDEVIKSIDKEFSFYNDTFVLRGIKYKLIFSYVASGEDIYNRATDTEGTRRILDEALEKFYKYKVGISEYLIREEINNYFISSPHNSYFIDLALVDKNGEIHYIDNIISHIRDKFNIVVERSYLKKALKASILLFTDFLSLSIYEYEFEKSLKYLEGTVLQPYISVLCDMKKPVVDRLSIYRGLSIYGGILSAITPTLPGVFVDFETIRGRLIEFFVVNRYPIYMRPRMDIEKERKSRIRIREGLVYISKRFYLKIFCKDALFFQYD